jgi:hypothetical protein
MNCQLSLVHLIVFKGSGEVAAMHSVDDEVSSLFHVNCETAAQQIWSKSMQILESYLFITHDPLRTGEAA